MGLLGGGNSGDGGAAALNAQSQANINQGMSQIGDVFSKYNQDYYNNIGKAYTSYAEPQVQQQYTQTKNNLAYALARNGILDSSAATQDQGALDKTLAANQTTVANNAQNEENTAQGNVQNARNTVTQQLISSNDPTAVQTGAAAATAGLNAPPTFAPLGNMFSDFTNTYLANINARAFNPQTQSIWGQLTGAF